MSLTLKAHSTLDDELLDAITTLDQAIFAEPISKQAFQRALQHRHQLVVLLATRDTTLCGYKIGYEFSPEVFYSFSGGVIPEYRRHGIARALLDEQHRIATELGYAIVRTHTKNRYRDMLILNLKSGFDITGINHKSGEKFQSIILEKGLVPVVRP